MIIQSTPNITYPQHNILPNITYAWKFLFGHSQFSDKLLPDTTYPQYNIPPHITYGLSGPNYKKTVKIYPQYNIPSYSARKVFWHSFPFFRIFIIFLTRILILVEFKKNIVDEKETYPNSPMWILPTNSPPRKSSFRAITLKQNFQANQRFGSQLIKGLEQNKHVFQALDQFKNLLLKGQLSKLK